MLDNDVIVITIFFLTMSVGHVNYSGRIIVVPPVKGTEKGPKKEDHLCPL